MPLVPVRRVTSLIRSSVYDCLRDDAGHHALQLSWLHLLGRLLIKSLIQVQQLQNREPSIYLLYLREQNHRDFRPRKFRATPGHELKHHVKSSQAKRAGKIYPGCILFEGAAKRSDPDGDLGVRAEE